MGTLHLQKKTKLYSYYPININVHVNTQSENILHTLHLHDIPLDAIFTFPSQALSSTTRIATGMTPPFIHTYTHTHPSH